MNGFCGYRGEKVRSDCRVSVETTGSGGVTVDVASKVGYMYADSIRDLIRAGCEHFGIAHARVQVEDQGALPFVIMARLETAIRRAMPGKTLPDWLPEPGPSFARPSSRDRWRRSRLYLPGNEPRFMTNARVYGPDAIILDLEDSVPPEEKDAALVLARNALITLDFAGCERMVRVNPLPRGLDELEPLIAAGVNLVLIPKCENDDDVEAFDKRISKVKTDREVFLMPIVETCAGVLSCRKIARASKRVVALTWGMEDYLADSGGIKTPAGLETLWARSQVVNAARAAGVQPIDTVYADIDDDEGLRASCRATRALGFEGKGCIHPRQVPVVNEAFSPSAEEIEHALAIVRANEEARAQGKSVAVVGTKMIDPPVVRRARRTVDLARTAGSLPSSNPLLPSPLKGEGKGEGENDRFPGANPQTPDPVPHREDA